MIKIIHRSHLNMSALFFHFRKEEFSRKSLYVFSSPSRREVLCFHPRLCRRETSRSFRGVPSGFVVSNSRAPLYPTTSLTRVLGFPFPRQITGVLNHRFTLARAH